MSTDGHGGSAAHSLDRPTGPATDDGDEGWLAERKKAFRREAMARRASEHERASATAAASVLAHLRRLMPTRAGLTVSGYAPIRNELDVMPVLTDLSGEGVRACLPVVLGRRRPLVFRLWQPETDLKPGSLGVGEPPSDAPEARPDVVLVPTLAFDPRGMRMGYGAGFYDRTLEALRASGTILAVGIAYSGQQFSEVPAGRHDQPIDCVVTEERTFIFDQGAVDAASLSR